ncbi:MAG: adenylate kinase [Cyanobacteria bacterium P01_A01_bin.15]
MQHPFSGQRISVVGTSGSGKTTLACEISQRLQIPHLELDALYWEPNWGEPPEDIFRQRVSNALMGDRWVVDGNYSKVRDIVWGRADTIVFLDYSFGLVWWRLWQRTVRRAFQQEELWNENRETIRQSFFSRESILLWMLQTYSERRKRYPQLFRQPEYQHLEVLHLQSQTQTNDWLALALKS